MSTQAPGGGTSRSRLVRKILETQVQLQLRNNISKQFETGLNGSGPFWFGLMTKLANDTPIPLLKAANGHLLPRVNILTPGGMTRLYRVQENGFGLAGGALSSDGLCYFDCTPLTTAAQVCQTNSYGARDDGCGDTITCQGICGDDQICSNNLCKACKRLTYGEVTAANCGPIPDGCGGFLLCLVCRAGTICKDQECVGFGGVVGLFCQQCKKEGEHCLPVNQPPN